MLDDTSGMPNMYETAGAAFPLRFGSLTNWEGMRNLNWVFWELAHICRPTPSCVCKVCLACNKQNQPSACARDQLTALRFVFSRSWSVLPDGFGFLYSEQNMSKPRWRLVQPSWSI
ncbi:unnamed protein product [Musa textilis]